ncbi:MAG: pyk [Bacillota bacterium]|nr:MAG: pyk [Bacillota bacterium]
MRKTKIVCTIGPTSESIEMLRELIRAGLDVARLNFSHGTHAEHLERINSIRQVAAEEGKHIAIMLDTKGPEIRIGTFATGSTTLEPGDPFTLTTEKILGTRDRVTVTYEGLPQDVLPGDRLLLDDGLIEIKVEQVVGSEIHCRTVVGGVVSNRKGINVPGKRVNLPAISVQDEADLKFGVDHNVDFIAASFMRSAADVFAIRKMLEKFGATIPIIAKIENKEGVDNLDSILKVVDGLMVARGDMGVEFPAEEVPIIQKQMIQKCNATGKPVITATQMLDSMIRNPRPTRAEASDVANAIYDGTDAIMLSGETANGKYPLESVQLMARIAERTERALPYEEYRTHRFVSPSPTVTNAISHATVQAAAELCAAAIVTSTQSGWTARMVSKYRPNAPIVAVTTDAQAARRLNLVWGVYPVMGEHISTTDEMMEVAVLRSLQAGYIKNGDLVVITAGIPVGVPGTTNLLKVHVVGDVLARGMGLGALNAEGKVCIARSAAEAIAKVNVGDILVTHSTDRDYMPALEKVSGIICEEGGLTSHAAIVGLNLGIATIVGVNGAMSILHDAELVTMDGGRGLVYRGHAKVR